ncbi:hypothetical protein [Streptomyces microflavus]|uniref:hypothetical protein n=1 Tax=Streptomyces microflavus TaxID=1919 RepID=UPI0033A77BE2
MTERVARVVEIVRGRLDELGDEDLLSVGVASKAVERALGVTETTARKAVASALETDALVEIGHKQRGLILPWPADVTEPPEVWVTGSPSRHHFYVTEYRQVGPKLEKTRFVFTPERLTALMDLKLREQGVKSAKEQQRREAQDAEGAAKEASAWEVLTEQRPALAGLLRRLNAELKEQQPDAAVWVSAKVHPQHGFIGRATLSVEMEGFDVLERVLRDGLGEEQG